MISQTVLNVAVLLVVTILMAYLSFKRPILLRSRWFHFLLFGLYYPVFIDVMFVSNESLGGLFTVAGYWLLSFGGVTLFAWITSDEDDPFARLFTKEEKA